MDKALFVSLVVGYGACSIFVLVYALAQAHLTICFRRASRGPRPASPPPMPWGDLPSVTVQLPIYNEMHVVERLLRAVTALRYPPDKLEIQVLDDSTDETKAFAARLTSSHRARGFQIRHICRPNRVGFKAGALHYGFERSSGEFYAIFDADFIPPPDFLLRTLPYFRDPNIGMVQTRWEHLNKGYSLLTRLQAFALDAHFTIEHLGRAYRRLFINFNGTGGVWRRKCIETAGGWHSDTLTEDLDLSYRAQLKGWRFAYLYDVPAPGELPVAMDAVKNQQYRWTKGAAECARKNLATILHSPALSPVEKGHAFFHHANSATFLCVTVLALFSVPLMLLRRYSEGVQTLNTLSAVYSLSIVFLTFFYWHAWSYSNPGSVAKRLRGFAGTFPLFLVVYMGLSFYNSKAVVLGYLGRKSPFIRTPKFNVTDAKQLWTSNRYMVSKFSAQAVVELSLAALFFTAVGFGIWIGYFGFLPFHLMMASGLAYVGARSLFRRVAK